MKIHYAKIQFATLFSQPERRNAFLTREKSVSSNHKATLTRIVFSAVLSLLLTTAIACIVGIFRKVDEDKNWNRASKYQRR